MSSSIARSAQHILSHTPVSSKVGKVQRKSKYDEGNTDVESYENSDDVSDASSSPDKSTKFSTLPDNFLNSYSK